MRRTDTPRRRLSLEMLESRIMLSAHSNSAWYLDQLDVMTPAQFAARVAEFSQGPGAPTGFGDPSVALGAPVQGSPSVPDNSDVVSLGQRNDPSGGRIVLGFDAPVADDPANPLGVDFVIFGNAFYRGGDPLNVWAEPAFVEIARDSDGDGRHEDETFYRIATTPTTYTEGYSGTFEAFVDTVPGNSAWSFLLPDDNAAPGISILSAGGTSIDIADADWDGDTPLTQVDFVRITDALAGDTDALLGSVSAEVEAVVDIDPLSTRPLVYDSDWFTFAGTDVGSIHEDENGTRGGADAVDLAGRSAVAVLGHIFDSADADYYSLGSLGAGVPLRAELFGGDHLPGISAVPAALNGLDARLTLLRWTGSELVEVAASEDAAGIDPIIEAAIPAAGSYYIVVEGANSGAYELDLLLEVADIDVASGFDFGTVVNDGAGGITSAQQIQIGNTGTVDLVIDDLSISGTGAAAFSLSAGAATPFTIPPGETAEVEITFDPTSSSGYSAMLEIDSNDLDEPTVGIALSGSGEDAAIVFENAAGEPLSLLDMGRIYADGGGNLHTRDALIIRNVSAAQTVTLNELTASATAFTVETPVAGTDLTPGEELTIEVTFDPLTAGQQTADLSLDTSLGAFTLDTAGRGLAYALSDLPAGFTSHELLSAAEADALPGQLQSGITFSEDGSTLWFTSGGFGAQDIFTLDVAAGDVTPLTVGDAFGSVASIVHDSANSRLLISDNVNFGSGDIYAVSLADGSVAQLASDIVPFIDDLVLAGATLYATSSAAGDAGAVYAIDTATWTATAWATGLSYANGLAAFADGSLAVGTTATDFASGSVYRLAGTMDSDADGVIEVGAGEGELLGRTTNFSGIGDLIVSDQDEVFVSQFGGSILRLDDGTFSTFATTILAGGEIAYYDGPGNRSPNTGDFLPSRGTTDALATDEDIIAMLSAPSFFSNQAGTGAVHAVSPDTAPALAVSLDALDFATVYNDGPGNVLRQATLTLTNAGTESLTILDAALTAGDLSDFMIDASAAATVLAPGESTDVLVAFDPDFTGPAVHDMLRITTNAGTTDVPVSGIGGRLGGLPTGMEYVDLLNPENADQVGGQVQSALAFSPGGQTLYFAAGAFMSMDVYALDVPSGAIADLTPAVNPFGSVSSIHYDAGGDRLLIADNVDFGAGDIYSLALDTGEVSLLVEDDVPYLDDLLLMPDGTLYASNAGWGDAGGIYLVDLDAGTAAPWATGLSFANGLSSFSDGALVVGTTATDFLSGSAWRLTEGMDADADGVIEVAAGEGELLAATTNFAGLADLVVDDQDRVLASQFGGQLLLIQDGVFQPYGTTPLAGGELAFWDGPAGAFLPYQGAATDSLATGEDRLAFVGAVPWDMAPFASMGTGVIHAINPAALAQISVTPESGEFGTVYVDGPGNIARAVSVTVTNEGTQALQVQTPSLAEGTQFSLDTAGFETTIAPGASSTLQVVFDPSATGVFTDSLFLVSNDPTNPGLTIEVAGTGGDFQVDRPGFVCEDLLDAANAPGVSGTVQNAMTFSRDGGRLYFAAGTFGSQDIMVMDLATGAVSDVTADEKPFGSVGSIVYDDSGDRLILSDNANFGSGRIFTVSLADGAVTLRSEGAVPFIDDLLPGPGRTLYASNADWGDAGGLYAIDTGTWTARLWATGLSFAGGLAKAPSGDVLVGTTDTDFAGGAVYRLSTESDRDLDGIIEVEDGEGFLVASIDNGSGILDIVADSEGFIYASQYAGNVLAITGAKLQPFSTDVLSAGELAYRDVGTSRFLPYAADGFGFLDALAIAAAPQWPTREGVSNVGAGTIHLVQPDLPPAEVSLAGGGAHSLTDADGNRVEVRVIGADARLILDPTEARLISVILDNHHRGSVLMISAENDGEPASTSVGAIYATGDGSFGRIMAEAVIDGEGVFIGKDALDLRLAGLSDEAVLSVGRDVRRIDISERAGGHIYAGGIRVLELTGDSDCEVGVRRDLYVMDVKEGDFSGSVSADGQIIRARFDAGLSGSIEAGSIRVVQVMSGDFTGTVRAGDIYVLDVTEGDSPGIVEADGKLVRARFGGAFSGVVQAHTITVVQVLDGPFTGSVESTLGDIRVVDVRGEGVMSGTIKAAGDAVVVSIFGRAAPADFTGRVETGGDLRVLNLAGSARFSDAAVRVGGTLTRLAALSADGLVLSAAEIGVAAFRGDVSGSALLAGYDIGADMAVGTDDDQLLGGALRSVSVRGALADSSLAAGVSPGPNGLFGDADDVGAGTNATFTGAVRATSLAGSGGIMADAGPFTVLVGRRRTEVSSAAGLIPLAADVRAGVV